jgi:Rha family phage regulatory protein
MDQCTVGAGAPSGGALGNRKEPHATHALRRARTPHVPHENFATGNFAFAAGDTTIEPRSHSGLAALFRNGERETAGAGAAWRAAGNIMSNQREEKAMTKNNDGDDGSRDADPGLDALVCVTQGKPMADSRVIAKTFGKRHNNVLRDIDKLMEEVKTLGAQNRAPRFVESNASNPTIPGLFDRYFELDRNAFMLLAMGFTGTEALRWKLTFIDAFETMESALAKENGVWCDPPPPNVEANAAWFEQILRRPGRYRLTVFPNQEPTIYKTDFDFIAKEDDQLNFRILAHYVQLIHAVWGRLRLVDSVLSQLKNNLIAQELDDQITLANARASFLLQYYDNRAARIV